MIIFDKATAMNLARTKIKGLAGTLKNLMNNFETQKSEKKSAAPTKMANGKSHHSKPSKKKARKTALTRKHKKAASAKTRSVSKKASKPNVDMSLKSGKEVIPETPKNPARSPGHRKISLKEGGKKGDKVRLSDSAENRMSPADRINRVTAQTRINGFISSAGKRRRAGSKVAH